MKYFAMMYLTTFGEWIEANGLAVLSMVAGWLISIGGLIWYLSGKFARFESQSKVSNDKVEALAKAFSEHEDDFRSHAQDTDVHSNFEYRQSVNARFAEIKHEMTDGHNRIENKIDKLIDRLIK